MGGSGTPFHPQRKKEGSHFQEHAPRLANMVLVVYPKDNCGGSVEILNESLHQPSTVGTDTACRAGNGKGCTTPALLKEELEPVRRGLGPSPSRAFELCRTLQRNKKRERVKGSERGKGRRRSRRRKNTRGRTKGSDRKRERERESPECSGEPARGALSL